MRHLMLVRAVAALLLSVPMPSFAQQSEATIYAAAKTERVVVYWGNADVKVFENISNAFVTRYPGIELQMSKLEAAPAIERIIVGKGAGRNDVDFIDTPLGYLPLLFNKGLVEAFDWNGALQTDRDAILLGAKGLVAWDLDMPISINTDLVKRSDITSWDDLLDPKWKGKIILEPRGLPFAVLALKWGETKTLTFIKALMNNKPIVVKGGTAGVEALAGGQGAIAVGPYGGRVLIAKDDGAPVDVARVGPVPAMLEAVVMIKGAPHPNATRLWMNFLTTPPAQARLYRGQGLGMVHGSSLSPLGALYRDAGVEVVMESPDPAVMQTLVRLVADAIGALH